MMYFILIVLGSYYLVMVYLYMGFRKLKSTPSEGKSEHGFSIIVPFRNEKDNLAGLIDSINRLWYPENQMEIIFVDDESTDGSAELIHKLLKGRSPSNQYKVLNAVRRSGSPKKDAILTAIEESSFEWILTTDADCHVPVRWLELLSTHISAFDPEMVCGPVFYRHETLIESYQFHEGLSLQLVAMGGIGWGRPLLCNGANLAYKKSTFYEVNGFKGNDHIASGDDIFMLEKIQSTHPNGVHFIKDPEYTVTTKPESSWRSIINQRVRWASKTSRQRSSGNKILGAYILLIQLLLVFGPLYAIVQPVFLQFWLALLIGKISIDLWLIRTVGDQLKNQVDPGRFLLDGLRFPVITIIVFFKSLKGKYRWKGRAYAD